MIGHLAKGMALIATGIVVTGCSTVSTFWSSNPPRRSFNVQPVWVQQLPSETPMKYRKMHRFSPVLFDHPDHGEVIIQGNGLDGISAHNAKTGQQVWKSQILNGVEAGAALSKGRLYLGASDGQFYALDARNGQILWSFPTRIENISTPNVAEGVVVFLSGSNAVYGLDEETGRQLWVYSRQDTQAISVRGGSRPAIDRGTVFIGTSDGAVVALNLKTGTVRWEKILNRNKRFRDLDSDPLVDGEFLYLSGFDNGIYALRTATGDLVWKTEKGGYGSLWLEGEALFAATTTGELVSLDRSSGKRRWAIPVKSGIATGIRPYKGLIVFGESQGSIRFVDAGSGKPIGSFDPGRGVQAVPLVWEKQNLTYFVSGEGNLYALEMAWKNSLGLQ